MNADSRSVYAWFWFVGELLSPARLLGCALAL